MSRIVAIDYGQKRAGIAVTDPLRIFATGLTTVHPEKLLIFLKEYNNKEHIELFVIGYPKQVNNMESKAIQHIKPFINKLKKEFPEIPVELMDERFTSKIAKQTMIDSGLKKKDRQNKELVDKISATIILQSYLEYINFQNS